MNTLRLFFAGISLRLQRLWLRVQLEADCLINREIPAFTKEGEGGDEVLTIVKGLRADVVLKEDFAREIAGIKGEVKHLPAVIKSVDDLKVLAEAAQQINSPIPEGGGEWKKAEKDGRGYREINLDWSHIRRATGHYPLDRTKAITTNDQTPGYRVGNIPPYFSLSDGDPLAPYCMMMNTQGDGGTKLPKVSGITFAAEGAHNLTRTNQGNIASATINTVTYTAEVIVPEPSMDDMNGLREALIGLFLEAASDIQGEKAAGTIITDGKLSSPNIGVVNTGVAATLPTAATLIGKLAAMRQTPKAAYRRQGVWQMNTSLYSKLLQFHNTDSPLEIRLDGDGLMSLWTRPVVENDQFDDGDVAGDVSAVFGNLRRGLVCASNEMLTIREYPATNPGAITFFARLRFVHSIWDGAALVALKTAE